jgi:prepilin-type N-terminal cleavage/methylation domain-containing protein
MRKNVVLKREEGFTLVELLISVIIFLLVIAAATSVFTSLLGQFKQQSKMAETNMEGAVGLEILRQDLDSAGYGLPWDLNGANYLEADVESQTPWVDRDFNDGPPTNPARGTDPAGASNPPAGVRSGNGDGLNGSDVLVIKAANVARNNTCTKWTILKASPFNSYNPRQWTPTSENLDNNDNVIVLSPANRVLVTDAANSYAFSTKYSNVTSAPWPPSDPADPMASHVVYGLAGSDVPAPRMPFNRADFYVRKPSPSDSPYYPLPSRCAPNTGVLFKANINQVNGRLNDSEIPLLDCVADMQVDFWLDTDGDGNINWPPVDDISNLTAQQIRDQLMEVRVYVVAQDGQKDPSYDFSEGDARQSLSTNEILGANSRTLNFADLRAVVGNPGYKYYRWKLYTIAVRPKNIKAEKK